jgi:hypothetical protein
MDYHLYAQHIKMDGINGFMFLSPSATLFMLKRIGGLASVLSSPCTVERLWALLMSGP